MQLLPTVRLYRKLEAGEQLVAAGDPGAGISYSAGVYISRKYLDVPLVFQARIESPQFGYELSNIGLYVKKKTGDYPLLAVERNIGQGTIEKLRNLGYPLAKLYRQKTFDRIAQKEEERIGWMTTVANRRKMLDELAMLIRNKGLKIYDEELISEMLTFVINERTGEPRPESGTYSDLIMALAIANQMLGEMPKSAKWMSPQHKENSKFLPKKAEGFVTEEYEPEHNQDWRSS